MTTVFPFLEHGIVTGTAINKVCIHLKPDRAAEVARLINTIAPAYKMDNVDILQEFIAQVAHESWEFTAKSENLNYKAEALIKTFGKRRFPTLIVAQEYAHQPQKIANFVYGGRLGNYLPNDGWDMRGGGFIQTTGRANWEAYAAYKRADVVSVAEKVRTVDEWAMDNACWVFARKMNLIQLAIDDAFITITRRINGGINGLADRQKYYELTKKYIV